MKLIETPLSGAFLIQPQPREDERGWFSRVFCARWFREHGLVDTFLQTNHSKSVSAGTIRGLHYQIPPAAEVKLMRCVRGRVLDVIVDVRTSSPTFLNWFAVELSCQNRNMIYVPCGFAHGFQALTDDCEVTYQSSAEYSPEHERQIRFNDPRIGIEWMLAEAIVSPKDASSPLLDDNFAGVEL